MLYIWQSFVNVVQWEVGLKGAFILKELIEVID